MNKVLMRRLGWTVFLLVALALILFGRSIVVIRTGPTIYPTAKPVTVAESGLFTTYACERLYGLTQVRSVVSSAYNYESNLLDGSPPVGDIDCLVPSGFEERVYLPGYPSDRFRYDGAVSVFGSGWVQKWILPNGGHLAFLHLTSMNTVTLGMPSITEPPGSGTARSDGGDNETARAVGAVDTHPEFLPSLGLWSGRAWVALSGWPSSYEFSNGSCGDYYSCEQDAHLCVVLDQAAADWLYAVLDGQHRPAPTPAPARFSLHRWQSWCKAKTGRVCDPAHRHHKLVWSAVVFSRHPRLGSKKHGDRWYGKAKTRSHGYSLYPFTHGTATCWPYYHRCKVKIT